eukprot:jgi/Antlo1/387/2200
MCAPARTRNLHDCVVRHTIAYAYRKNRVPFAASRCTRLVISRRLLSPPSVSKMMFLLMLPSSAAGFRSTALCSPATMHVPPLGPAFSLTHSFLSRSPCSLVSLSLHPLNRTSLSQHSWSKNTTFTCMLRSHTVLINTSIASDTSLCGTVPPHFHPIDPDLSTTRMISRLHRTALRSTSILGTIVSSTTLWLSISKCLAETRSSLSILILKTMSSSRFDSAMVYTLFLTSWSSLHSMLHPRTPEKSISKRKVASSSERTKLASLRSTVSPYLKYALRGNT